MIGYFIYLILKGFSFLINLFPEGFALWVGRQMGNVAYYLDWEHRNVALQNLRIAFGQEKSEEERRSIAKRNFQHMGMMLIEFFRILGMDTETFKKKVSVEGLDEALRLLEKKKGGLLLIGHFGNWELMGIMSKVIQIPILADRLDELSELNRLLGSQCVCESVSGLNIKERDSNQGESDCSADQDTRAEKHLSPEQMCRQRPSSLFQPASQDSSGKTH